MKKLFSVSLLTFLGAGLIVFGSSQQKQLAPIYADGFIDGKLINQDFLDADDLNYEVNVQSIVDNSEEGLYGNNAVEHSFSFYLEDDIAINKPIYFFATDDYYVFNIYLNSHVVSLQEVHDTSFPGFCRMNTTNITDPELYSKATINIYGGSGITHYFSKNNVTHLYKLDDYGLISYKGGCFTGFEGCALYLNGNGVYNLHDLNIVGNNYAILTTDTCEVNVFNTLIEDNCTDLEKVSTVQVNSNSSNGAADLFFDGCTIKNNHTHSGSAIYVKGAYSADAGYTLSGNIYLNNTQIINNTNDTNIWSAYLEAGTVETSAGLTLNYDFIAGCFAEGTKVNLANGQTVNVEDVQSGDKVLTYNHNTGTLESQEILNVYDGESKANSFTLNFANDIDVDVVGAHGFLCKEENKYINIDEDNANSYVGKSFYNAIDDKWETLESVTYNNDNVSYYAFYTAYNYNAVVEKMLTLEDDCLFACNLFDFADGKVYDPAKKQADIDHYGLVTLEDIGLEMSQEVFEKTLGQYLNISLGKGLVSYQQIVNAFSSYDYTGEHVDGKKQLKMPLMLASDSIGADQHGLVLGSNVVIKNNYMLEENEPSNLLLSPYNHEGNYLEPLVYFDNSANCDIHIRSENEFSLFSSNVGSDAYLDFFTSERDGYYCDYSNNNYYEDSAKRTVNVKTEEQYREYTGEGIKFALQGNFGTTESLDDTNFTFKYQYADTLEYVDIPVKKGRYLVTIDFPGDKTTHPFHDTRYMTIGTRVAFNNVGAEDPVSLSGTFDTSKFYTGNVIYLPYPEKTGDLHLNVEEGYEFAGWYDYTTNVLHKYGTSTELLANNYVGTRALAAVTYPNDYSNPTKANEYDVMPSLTTGNTYSYQWQKYGIHQYNILEVAMGNIVYFNAETDADGKITSTLWAGKNTLSSCKMVDQKIVCELKLSDPTVHLQLGSIDTDTETYSQFVDLEYNDKGLYTIEIDNQDANHFVTIKAKDDAPFKCDNIKYYLYDYFDIAGETSSQIQVANENTSYRCKVTNDYGVSSYTNSVSTKAVTFHTDGGVMSDEGAYALDGRKVDLSDYIPYKERYDFIGWATSENGSVVYDADDVITLTDNIDLYAKYFIKNNQFSGTAISGKGTTESPVTGTVENAIVGDTYLNSSTLDMYRFDGTNWSFIGSIKGEKGDTDEIEGKSAYDIAVENGFTGTEEEWLNSLIGEAGADGESGTNLLAALIASGVVNVGSVVMLFFRRKTI